MSDLETDILEQQHTRLAPHMQNKRGCQRSLVYDSGAAVLKLKIPVGKLTVLHIENSDRFVHRTQPLSFYVKVISRVTGSQIHPATLVCDDLTRITC